MERLSIRYGEVNRDIIRVLFRPSLLYLAALLASIAMLAWGAYCWYLQARWGMGVAGITHPTMWGVYIATFVFWIGIGHAGTLVSAILYLVRAPWRTGVYRAAEAMTVIAVMTAMIFPLLHLGRFWQVYWAFPYPGQRLLGINFKSPLTWDVFAIATYFVVSAVFLFIGLIPDLAVYRDHCKGPMKRVYGIFALGWRGTSRQWHHYLAAYGIFAAFAAPLVFSVHSIVSWDFAMARMPGWHSTIFAPYFVAGAIFSGCAMVITLMLPLSHLFGWQKYLNTWHFENLAKICLLTSLILTYAYVMEFFVAWYSQNPYEQQYFLWRVTGDYAIIFWVMLLCNCVVPLLFFFKKVRTNHAALMVIAILINLGMWLERFNIVVSPLALSLDPAVWGLYWPTQIEWGILVGSFGWFFFWFLLFIKTLPAIAITEVKEMVLPPLKTTGEGP